MTRTEHPNQDPAAAERHRLAHELRTRNAELASTRERLRAAETQRDAAWAAARAFAEALVCLSAPQHWGGKWEGWHDTHPAVIRLREHDDPGAVVQIVRDAGDWLVHQCDWRTVKAGSHVLFRPPLWQRGHSEAGT